MFKTVTCNQFVGYVWFLCRQSRDYSELWHHTFHNNCDRLHNVWS